MTDPNAVHTRAALEQPASLEVHLFGRRFDPRSSLPASRAEVWAVHAGLAGLHTLGF